MTRPDLKVLTLFLAAFAGDLPAYAQAKKPSGPSKDTSKGEHFWESYSPPAHKKVSTAFELTDKLQVEEVIEAPQDYTYASFEKPNPFLPSLLSNYLSKFEVPIISDLQKYRIEMLKTIGIWVLDNKERRALILTPDNEAVVVGVGDFVGNRGGRVAGINGQRVRVREFTVTPDGSRIFEDFELYLQDEAPKKQEVIIIPSRQNLRSTLDIGKGYLDTTPVQRQREEDLIKRHEAHGRKDTQAPTQPNHEKGAVDADQPTRPATTQL